jgi:hypothetical protein
MMYAKYRPLGETAADPKPPPYSFVRRNTERESRRYPKMINGWFWLNPVATVK